MSRISLIVVTFALGISVALASALPSQAAQSEPRTTSAALAAAKESKSLRGVVVSKTASELTLKGPRDRTITVQLNAGTKYEQRGHTGSPLTLSDVAVGSNVTVYGAKPPREKKRKDATTTSPTVTAVDAIVAVRVVLPPIKTATLAGSITALSATSITVARPNGKGITAAIASTTSILPAGTALAVGDLVRVQTTGTGASVVAKSITKITKPVKAPGKPKKTAPKVTPTPITTSGAPTSGA